MMSAIAWIFGALILFVAFAYIRGRKYVGKWKFDGSVPAIIELGYVVYGTMTEVGNPANRMDLQYNPLTDKLSATWNDVTKDITPYFATANRIQ